MARILHEDEQGVRALLNPMDVECDELASRERASTTYPMYSASSTLYRTLAAVAPNTPLLPLGGIGADYP